MTAQGPAAGSGAAGLAGKYLTFNLGTEGYGLPILKVREIIGVQRITAIPAAPDYMKGVIDLRGTVIPVLDLRLRLGMPPRDHTRDTCIVVVQARHGSDGAVAGVVVDQVSEVLDIGAGEIEATPALGRGTDVRCILGVAKVGTGVKVLLDIDGLVSPDDARAVVAEAGPPAGGVAAGAVAGAEPAAVSAARHPPGDSQPQTAAAADEAGAAAMVASPAVAERVPRGDDELMMELRQCADVLVDKLEGDHYEEAAEVISRLVEARDRSIFGAVGGLTRGLHEAIKNVQADAGEGSPEMSDATDRLSYVIATTQAAAENTLEKVEAAVPVAAAMGDEAQGLRAAWAERTGADGTVTVDGELESRVDRFFAALDGGTSTLRQHLQDIMLEQGYQDLTGQVLARVITLIKAVEHDLVGLVKLAGQVDYLTGQADTPHATVAGHVPGATEAEGPNIHGERRADTVSGQDEVDDLLSQLGF